MRRRVPLTICVFAGLLVLPGAAAQAKTETAGAGQVAATLTYDHTPATARLGDSFANLRLAISRYGAVVYNRPVVSADWCGTSCWPGGLGRQPSVRVVDLDADGDPEVVLDLYTGGAHCCSLTQVFRWQAIAGSYALTEHAWGDPGSLLTTPAGNDRPLFESADDRFAYEFSAFAFSGLPVQIFQFDDGRLTDVTRSFPELVRADARRWWGRYLANYRQGLGLGFLAAWAADQCLLHHRTFVARALRREARLGRLRSGDHLSPSGAGFVRHLERFLRRTGYA